MFANTGLKHLHESLLQTPSRVQFAEFQIHKPFLIWINDGLMVLFFFLVGMESKRELLEAELCDMATARLPAMGAFGGMMVPRFFYWWINDTNPAGIACWAIYADTPTTYRSPSEPTVAEQLAGMEPASQFSRALQELGVEVIATHSPQAEERVERLFKTVQDRLVKELRLARIVTLEAANRFLGGYLPIYKRRFTIGPWLTTDSPIRSTTISGPRASCWKNDWMGQCG
jgi:hypothetical protein